MLDQTPDPDTAVYAPSHTPLSTLVWTTHNILCTIFGVLTVLGYVYTNNSWDSFTAKGDFLNFSFYLSYSFASFFFLCPLSLVLGPWSLVLCPLSFVLCPFRPLSFVLFILCPFHPFSFLFLFLFFFFFFSFSFSFF
jgi:hypothetical protein